MSNSRKERASTCPDGIGSSHPMRTGILRQGPMPPYGHRRGRCAACATANCNYGSLVCQCLLFLCSSDDCLPVAKTPECGYSAWCIPTTATSRRPSSSRTAGHCYSAAANVTGYCRDFSRQVLSSSQDWSFACSLPFAGSSGSRRSASTCMIADKCHGSWIPRLNLVSRDTLPFATLQHAHMPQASDVLFLHL